MTRRRTIGALAGGAVVLSVGVAPAVASPSPAPTVVVAGAATLGGDVALVSSAAATERVSFRIDLGLRDEAAAERYATAVVTPGSPESGRFLSEAQFTERFGARTEQIAALRTWLTSQKITIDEVVGDQIVVASSSAGAASRAFGTRIAHVRSASGVVTASAVSPLRVPERFDGLVSGVSGLRPARAFATDLVRNPKALLSAARSGATPRAAAAPAKDPSCPSYFGETTVVGFPKAPFSTTRTSYTECSLVTNPFTSQPVYLPGASTAKLRTLSRVGPAYTGRGVTVGIVLWNNDVNTNRLANVASKTNGSPLLRNGQVTQSNTTVGSSNCQPTTEGDKVEIALDVQSVHAFAPDANIRYYGSTRCVVPEVSLAQAVGEETPPSVLSNSWGYPNGDYDPADPTSKSLHTSLVKAAIRGVTVLFSTGDTGDGTLLRSNFPEVSPPAPYPARTPGYPATDPYAVAVGGVGFGTAANGSTSFKQAWVPTYYSNANGRSTWEVVTPRNTGLGPNALGTSGGTSRVFAAPDWQKSAGVSSTGRKVPDISNAADLFFGPELIAINEPGVGEEIVAVGGTSMAAPLTAGQVATANQYRARPYLGLITPSLYRLRTSTAVSDVGRFQSAVVVPGFFDSGLNLMVGGERPRESLITTPGWDGATGLGTPGSGFIGNIGR